MTEEQMLEPSGSFERPRRHTEPPWWLTIVFGTVLAAATGAAGWAVNGLVDVRAELVRHTVTIRFLEERAAVTPAREDIEGLRREMVGLKEDLRELRADIKELRK